MRAIETMREQILKSPSFEMCAGLQFDDSDPNATTAPELTFNLRKQMSVGSPEYFSLGLNVVIYVYCKDLAVHLGLEKQK